MTDETTPAVEAAGTRVTRLRRLRAALDGGDRQKLLADGVAERLDHLWRTGGRDDTTAMGIRPSHIKIRAPFVYARRDDARSPVVPLLVQTQGLQLRLQLLLLFDAQCRYSPGTPVRNPRNIVRRADDQYAGWRELVLSDVRPAKSYGGDNAPPRVKAELRRRQIIEALARLEQRHLVKIPRQAKGNRRYDEFQLLSEVASSEHPDYTVPSRAAVTLPREFFTNLWVWVLSDAEIATYLMLRFVRARRPRRHDESGVFVTSGWRETLFRLHRSTWRSADMLYRLRLIDKMPSAGRTFRTGKVGDPKMLAENARKPVVRYKINDEALQAHALTTAWQVLTGPSEQDRVRREHGPLVETMDPLVALSLGLDAG
ncbi:hypothetical protein AWW66_06970 [Micromonospora rosaria]|uniref:Uncharacterized protein n=1 Tax=Micromonospora rosaria TaxID=47874 RepID=A0A136PVV0_9ACTN|nr:hypothetical protein [Micromonospora rosaria]KXK62661.1 hypothetical protein AWW66_06970 [Micromonospora rosaria]